MSKRRVHLAAFLTAAAGLAVVICGVWLTVAALQRQRAVAAHNTYTADLRDRGQEDATLATALHAEYTARTDADLARETRLQHIGYVLLVAVAIFLTSGKWLLTLIRSTPTVPVFVRDRCASCAAPPPEHTCTCAAQAAAPDHDLDLAPVADVVHRLGRDSSATIPILHALQAHYRYLPTPALRRVAELTEIGPAQLAGVASFYSRFRRTPVGEHLIHVCHGTACHVAGATQITEELRRRLGLAPGQDTDAARQFTIQAVPCLGCCTLAPVVQIDHTTHGHLCADNVPDLLAEARAHALTRGATKDAPPATTRSSDSRAEIRLGMGSCCQANGSDRVHDALQAAVAAAGVPAVVKRVGCVGMCHQTPFIEIDQPGQAPALYSRVQPEHAVTLLRRHFKPDGLAGRLRDVAAATIDVFRDDGTRRTVTEHVLELRDPPVAAFLGRQKHIATEHYGRLDPLDLDEYLAHDGFVALRRCLELPPDEIIAQVRHSGLRGRGGAGFPTWEKWAKVRAALGETKYLIVNGDEGDPGAFMDRMLMESYPYRLIEGVLIAALATGATEGFFYIRAEYPLAVERVTAAIQECERRGYLGNDVLGSGRALRLRVVQGAGAFVCGEETALIASLEGRRGLPTLRPPYPAERGLWGRPTLVNNVETYTVLPWIFRHGPDAFAALGTQTSKGTKVFALAGKVRRGGLIEVPMGITIRQIVMDIGGGVKDEQTAAGKRTHTFKAVQIGGPSGGCVPARLADTPVDFEALRTVGAMMGSGGLVVLDETDCMVDIARYFLSFTQSQSCGKCAPCRIGTRRMLEILERLCAGQGAPGDLDTLEELGRMVAATSLCGLGQTAPNPVLTTLRYFRDEYEAHLAGRCPAGRCRELIAYRVTERCTGCTLCAQHCPAGAIALRPHERHTIDLDKCTRCDVCRTRCPEDAIEIVGDRPAPLPRREGPGEGKGHGVATLIAPLSPHGSD